MRRVVALILLAILVTVGSVSASWTYAREEVPPISESLGGVSIGVFEFAPDEILPGGGMVEVPLGGNHYTLVDLVLNENDKGYGLNINNNVLIHQYLKNKSVIYSNQKVSGGNLKFIIDPSNNTHGLYYCIEKVSDTVYYCYTFMVSDLLTGYASGTEIDAYRTTLTKTDIWRATTSFLGRATVRLLTAFDESADPKSEPYSIDVTTWHS